MKKILILLSVLLLVSCSTENEIQELTIYTSRQPQLLEPIIEDFFEDKEYNYLLNGWHEYILYQKEIIKNKIVLVFEISF